MNTPNLLAALDLPTYPLSAISDYVSWWQWLLLLVMIGLVALFFYMRKNQQ